jgi:hypothetical protein
MAKELSRVELLVAMALVLRSNGSFRPMKCAGRHWRMVPLALLGVFIVSLILRPYHFLATILAGGVTAVNGNANEYERTEGEKRGRGTRP